ncbi:hypothetical protein ABID43_003041 [Methylobacterium goesingense]|uniref:Recombinase zinc beta ribbon domain-containing protein n=2 Tax=Methylobacterium goesingense TaxID=243690 RepID=A0ABV2L6M8_9HYPH
MLNATGCETFGSSTGWHDSYVHRILKNRSVIGEMQPYRLEGGKRMPDGEPVLGYYPAAVDSPTFFQVQALLHQRRNLGGGRKGKYVTNLFSKVASCAYCGAPMRIRASGNRAKDHLYLVCDRGRRGAGCFTTRWRYDHFEASFLTFVRELDLASLESRSDPSEEAALLESESLLSETIRQNEEKRENLLELILGRNERSEFLDEKLKELECSIYEWTRELSDTKRLISNLREEKYKFSESKEKIAELVIQAQNADDPSNYRLRSAIASRLSSLISELVLANAGGRPITSDTIDLICSESLIRSGVDRYGAGAQEMICQIRHALADPLSDRQFFIVKFADGTLRGVRPRKDDPREFETQIFSGPKGVHQIDRLGFENVASTGTDAIELILDPMVQVATF